MQDIVVVGARTHNLKNINLNLPRNQLIIFTGVSGSGKSSLAFGTLYAEGQRRYMECLSNYVRQFLPQLEKPDVDELKGLSPAIAIEQKTSCYNVRSTVGTITEIYDYFRLLYARVGKMKCPEHGHILASLTVNQMVTAICELPSERIYLLLAPVARSKEISVQVFFKQLLSNGFHRVHLNSKIIDLTKEYPEFNESLYKIDVVVDRFKVGPAIVDRLADSIELALQLSEGFIKLSLLETPHVSLLQFSSKPICFECEYTAEPLTPKHFSFNSPIGACNFCNGMGMESFFDPKKIVHAPELSIARGAIRGWDHRQAYKFRLLKAFAEIHDIDLERPFKELSLNQQKAVLYGSIKLDQAGSTPPDSAFKGIIPYIEQRYKETRQMAIKLALATYLSQRPCQACHGNRLKSITQNVYFADSTLHQLTQLSIKALLEKLNGLSLTGQTAAIANPLLDAIKKRLNFLIAVGLDYLSLDRTADTLSGGEAQRIRLASQIGAGLVGVMYVLDEPSIGLHPRDTQRLIRTLQDLRDLGNTLIVVEHDEETILSADYLVDIGPGAGTHGGHIVATGSPESFIKHPVSLTGKYLAKKIEVVSRSAEKQTLLTKNFSQKLTLHGATGNNLKNISFTLPLGKFVCVTGVSGSGKSTLVNETLVPLVKNRLSRKNTEPVEPYTSITGIEYIDKLVNINQRPIGKTPHSNPSTYIGLFTEIRELFATLPEAKIRGYNASRFSFNVSGGRCENCSGEGMLKITMHFLPDVYTTCEHCKGARYNRETLQVKYKAKNIADVLALTVEEALPFFSNFPVISKKLNLLQEVGLGYLTLGQSATTLSGGEAQRIKLAKELTKRDTGKTLYVLDEPTTGLHFADVSLLLKLLHRLKGQGNTVLVIEHHLDVIKSADWIIDLGPEGGDKGGSIVAEGTPFDIASHPTSFTGAYLHKHLQA